jgi:hypothetical protein
MVLLKKNVAKDFTPVETKTRKGKKAPVPAPEPEDDVAVEVPVVTPEPVVDKKQEAREKRAATKLAREERKAEQQRAEEEAVNEAKRLADQEKERKAKLREERKRAKLSVQEKPPKKIKNDDEPPLWFVTYLKQKEERKSNDQKSVEFNDNWSSGNVADHSSPSMPVFPTPIPGTVRSAVIGRKKLMQK